MEFNFTDKELEIMKRYAELYEDEREMDGTADPIVVVQSKTTLPSDWNKSYDEVVYIVDCEGDYHEFDSEEEAQEFIDEWESDEEIEEIPVHVVWKDVAYFLTREEANRYVEYQRHNLTSPRVYTKNMGYANYGDLLPIMKMVLRIGRGLNK